MIPCLPRIALPTLTHHRRAGGRHHANPSHTHRGVIAAYAISGCCNDHPDLCDPDASIIDAGLPAGPCWTPQRPPLRTESTVRGPANLRILGCARMDADGCRRGLARHGAPYDRNQRAPAGAWVTVAE